jgi:hypothetical protein
MIIRRNGGEIFTSRWGRQLNSGSRFGPCRYRDLVGDVERAGGRIELDAFDQRREHASQLTGLERQVFPAIGLDQKP